MQSLIKPAFYENFLLLAENFLDSQGQFSKMAKKVFGLINKH